MDHGLVSKPMPVKQSNVVTLNSESETCPTFLFEVYFYVNKGKYSRKIGRQADELCITTCL